MAISLEEAERMFRNRKGVDMSKIRKEIAAAEAVRNGEKNVQKPDTSDSKL